MLKTPLASRTIVIAACLVMQGASAGRLVAAAPATDKRDVASLVEQLGSDDYYQRRDAQQQLLQIGPQAFDALQTAQESPDLEIASRAAYILQQLRVQWTRSTDPASVREALAGYHDLADDRREQVIRRLANLPQGQGVGALVRIARFDPAEHIAREAALALIEMEQSVAASATETIERELGSSKRVAADWLRALIVEQREPEQAASLWRSACEAEAKLLVADDGDADWYLMWRLWRHELDFCDAHRLAEPAAEAVFHIVDVARMLKDDVAGELRFVLAWCLEKQNWEVLEIVAQRYAEQIRDLRELRYYLAAAYQEQGKPALAEETAEQAYRMSADDDETRRMVASRLAALGRLDWAEREWQYVIDHYSEIDENSIIARFDLASWRFDREEYREAAELLAPTCEALAGNKAERLRLQQSLAEMSDAPDLSDFLGRRDYYLANYYQAIGEFESEATHLQRAADLYQRNINVDVLIAMVHAKGGDEAYRQQAEQRIRREKRRQLAEIEEWKDHAGGVFAASRYNEWAWLTANTSSDPQELARAIQFSQKSLELRPDEPAFLDTLGRCYYAAGDYENAVKHQRRAIELQPHLEVMQRQLRLFEKKLEQRGDKQTP